MVKDIAGQYFGTYKSHTTGQHGKIIVNLDRRLGGFSGSMAVIESNHGQIPHSGYFVTLHVDNFGQVQGHADRQGVYQENEGRLRALTNDELNRSFPAAVIPSRIELKGLSADTSLEISFSTDKGTNGQAAVTKKAPGEKSIVNSESIDWNTFKIRAGEEGRHVIYRGQLHDNPLRTSFHRKERYDLIRFEREDMHRLEQSIISATDMQFDRNNPRMLAALLGIAQHHGYPTPLLDWTRSPYIAAYFACRDAIRLNDASPVVFWFDCDAWNKAIRPAESVTEWLPNIALIGPLPLKNPRVVPQQSVLMFCNIDDLESYIAEREKEKGLTFLKAYRLTDNPFLILEDLIKMGIYAGSLFPGLDGACRGVYEESIEP